MHNIYMVVLYGWVATLQCWRCKDGRTLASTLTPTVPWRESYDHEAYSLSRAQRSRPA